MVREKVNYPWEKLNCKQLEETNIRPKLQNKFNLSNKITIRMTVNKLRILVFQIGGWVGHSAQQNTVNKYVR